MYLFLIPVDNPVIIKLLENEFANAML
jgi:hypothetical protein